jgi:hypothetical protein
MTNLPQVVKALVCILSALFPCHDAPYIFCICPKGLCNDPHPTQDQFYIAFPFPFVFVMSTSIN